MNFELEYDVAVIDNNELRGMCGLIQTEDDLIVNVECHESVTSDSEIVTLYINGELPAIISWWQAQVADNDQLMREIQEAITNEALHPRH